MGRGDSRKTLKILRRRGQKKLQERIIRRKEERAESKKASVPSQSTHTQVEETTTPSTSTRVRKRSVAN